MEPYFCYSHIQVGFGWWFRLNCKTYSFHVWKQEQNPKLWNWFSGTLSIKRITFYFFEEKKHTKKRKIISGHCSGDFSLRKKNRRWQVVCKINKKKFSVVLFLKCKKLFFRFIFSHVLLHLIKCFIKSVFNFHRITEAEFLLSLCFTKGITKIINNCMVSLSCLSKKTPFCFMQLKTLFDFVVFFLFRFCKECRTWM